MLVKFLFASEPLSIQVHPADGDGVARGKSEMWHILDAEPGAVIGVGFREPLTRERLRESARTGEIERLLNWIPVKPGETYFTPARTVHAIGAGVVLCEIQQNCDVTYRLWDYGRPRELHLEQGVAVADLGVHPGASVPRRISDSAEELVRCPYFVTEMVHPASGARHIPVCEQSQLWICLEGRGSFSGEAYREWEVWLLPDDGPTMVEAATGSRFLRTYAPRG